MSDNDKKAVVKEIIEQLHEGLSVEEARDRFVREVGEISATEIADIEQELIEEGVSPDEIKEFCNVHALLFEEALQENVTEEESPTHPVHLFKMENREIESRARALGQLLEEGLDERSLESLEATLRQHLESLRELDRHYTRKEQILFPYLERHGFSGPSKVMWGKDDEIRALRDRALAALGDLSGAGEWAALVDETLRPLVEEIEGMIFKEENILFPAAMERLDAAEWAEVLRESEQVGYAYIDPPEEIAALVRQMREIDSAVAEEPQWRDGEIAFETGGMNLPELNAILHALPVEITFVDAEDRVRFFSDHPHRIFVRTKSVIGREVRYCHPPDSVDRVEEIVESFKNGTRRRADFWLEIGGRFIYIEFIALHDARGQYIGTLELTQDITEHRERSGERRLLDDIPGGGDDPGP